jgi:hypothetical protein
VVPEAGANAPRLGAAAKGVVVADGVVTIAGADGGAAAVVVTGAARAGSVVTVRRVVG